MVIIVCIGHDGVQPVVPARHLEDHENSRVLAGRRAHAFVRGVGLQLRKRVCEKRRHRPRERRTQRGGPQEVATSFKCHLIAHSFT